MLAWAKDLRYWLIWIALLVLCALAHPFTRFHPAALGWLAKAVGLIVLFFSVMVHETMHGTAALWCGDDTARNAGRLTLNPLRHISLVGTILVPIALSILSPSAVFGWAKPVPFDPLKLKKHPRDQSILSVAGPFSNFGLAFAFLSLFLVSGLGFKAVHPSSSVAFEIGFATPVTFGRPVPAEALWFTWFEALRDGTVVNLALGVFNLIPIPPLDGFWILKSLLPKRMLPAASALQLVGFVLIFIAIKFNLIMVFLYPLYLLFGGAMGISGWVLR
jgi:Zn-dependent protease